MAGEAGVPFFSISGSDFVEMFVGVGASRVRDLFEEGKKHAPCIIFIDEIDAVARQRGTGMGGGHDEREQTLNQLLVEMDGFGVNEGIIVMAATNRVDILDPAILRPGRFDRKVAVGRPDVKGREEILRVHAKDKPLGEDVDLEQIAQTTAGFTGADLENLLERSCDHAQPKQPGIIFTQPDINSCLYQSWNRCREKQQGDLRQRKEDHSLPRSRHMRSFSMCFQIWDPVYTISIIPTRNGSSRAIPCLCRKMTRCLIPRGKMLQDITTLPAADVWLRRSSLVILPPVLPTISSSATNHSQSHGYAVRHV